MVRGDAVARRRRSVLMLVLLMCAAWTAVGLGPSSAEWSPSIPALEVGWDPLIVRSGGAHDARPGTGFGSSMVALDDLDADGIPELAVGAPDAPGGGEVWILRGALVAHGEDVTTPWRRLVSPHAGGRFGEMIVAPTDLDADGLHEVVVSAPSALSGAGWVGAWSMVGLAAWNGQGTQPAPVWSMAGSRSGTGLGAALVAVDLDTDGAPGLALLDEQGQLDLIRASAVWRQPLEPVLADDDPTTPEVGFAWVNQTGNDAGLTGVADGWDWLEGGFGQARPWATDGAHLHSRQPLSGVVGDGAPTDDAAVLEIALGASGAAADGPVTPVNERGGHLESAAWAVGLLRPAGLPAVLAAGGELVLSMDVEIVDMATVLGVGAASDVTCEVLLRLTTANGSVALTPSGSATNGTPVLRRSWSLGSLPAAAETHRVEVPIGADAFDGAAAQLELGARMDARDSREEGHEGCRVRFDDVQLELRGSHHRVLELGSDSLSALAAAAGERGHLITVNGTGAQLLHLDRDEGLRAVDLFALDRVDIGLNVSGLMPAARGPLVLQRSTLASCDFSGVCVATWSLASGSNCNAAVNGSAGTGGGAGLVLSDDSETEAAVATWTVSGALGGNQLRLGVRDAAPGAALVVSLTDGGSPVVTIRLDDGRLELFEEGLLEPRAIAEHVNLSSARELVIDVGPTIDVHLDGRPLVTGAGRHASQGIPDALRVETLGSETGGHWVIDDVRWLDTPAPVEIGLSSVLDLVAPGAGWQVSWTDGAGVDTRAQRSVGLGRDAPATLLLEVPSGAEHRSIERLDARVTGLTDLAWPWSSPLDSAGIASTAAGLVAWVGAPEHAQGRGAWYAWPVDAVVSRMDRDDAITWRHGLFKGQAVGAAALPVQDLASDGDDDWLLLDASLRVRLVDQRLGNLSGRSAAWGVDLVQPASVVVTLQDAAPAAAPGLGLTASDVVLLAIPLAGEVLALRLDRGIELKLDPGPSGGHLVSGGLLQVNGTVASHQHISNLRTRLIDGRGVIASEHAAQAPESPGVISFLDLSAVADGTYAVEVIASDATGSEVRANGPVVIVGFPGQNVPPNLRLDAPLDGAVVAGDVLWATGEVTDADGEVPDVDVRLDDGPWLSATLESADADEWHPWRVALAMAGVAPGRHVLLVRAGDAFLTDGALIQRTIHRPTGEAEAPELTLDLVDGRYGLEPLIVRGTVSDAADLLSARWVIRKGDTEQLAGGDLLTALEPAAAAPDGRLRWTWSLTLYPAAWAPCSCIVEVSVQDVDGLQAAESRLVLAGGPSDDLAPALLLTSPAQLDGVRSPLSLDARLVDDGLDPPLLDVRLDAGRGETDGCPSGVGWARLQYDVISGSTITAALGTSLGDGWISLALRPRDLAGNIGVTTCRVLRLNALAPTAVLVAPDLVEERSTPRLLDASKSTDPGWGRSALIHQWSIQRPDGTTWTPPQTSPYMPTVLAPFTVAGSHVITLRVVDEDGLSTTRQATVTVTNRAPSADIALDGRPFDPVGGALKLIPGVEYVVSAVSTDTDNDLPTLSHEWSVDEVVVSRQSTALLELERGTHTLLLVTTDDDGVTARREVTLVVGGSPGGSDAGDLGVLGIVAAAGLLAVLLLVAVFRRPGRGSAAPGERRAGIPSWGPGRSKGPPAWKAIRVEGEETAPGADAADDPLTHPLDDVVEIVEADASVGFDDLHQQETDGASDPLNL